MKTDKLFKVIRRRELSSAEYVTYDKNALRQYQLMFAAALVAFISIAFYSLIYVAFFVILISYYFTIQNMKILGTWRFLVEQLKRERHHAKKYLIRFLICVGAIVVTGLILLLIFLPSVSAADTTKWTICGALNISGGPCDDFWNNFTQTLVPQVNQTIVDMYNKSYIDDLEKNLTRVINNLNSTLQNATVNSTVNSSDYLKVSEFVAFRNNFTSDFMRKDEAIYLNQQSEDSSSSPDNTLLIFGGIIVVILMGVVFMMFSNQKNTPRYIQNSNTASNAENAVRTLMKSINKAKNSPPVEEEQPIEEQPQPEPLPVKKVFPVKKPVKKKEPEPTAEEIASEESEEQPEN